MSAVTRWRIEQTSDGTFDVMMDNRIVQYEMATRDEAMDLVRDEAGVGIDVEYLPDSIHEPYDTLVT